MSFSGSTQFFEGKGTPDPSIFLISINNQREKLGGQKKKYYVKHQVRIFQEFHKKIQVYFVKLSHFYSVSPKLNQYTQ